MMSKGQLLASSAVLSLASTLLCCTATPSLAAAQGPSDDASAYAVTIQRAVTEFEAGHWEEAHALFRRAHELNPNARTWRGLGIAAFEARQYVEATADLEAALLDPRKPLSPEQRAEAQGLIERARAFISVYHMRIRPETAQVVVDGRAVALKEQQIHLDPGPHTIIVRAPGYEERRAELRAGAGDEGELSLELSIVSRADDERAGERHAAASPAGRVQAADAPQPKRRRRVWTWALASGSVAAGVVAAALRWRVRGLEREFADCSAAGGRCEPIKSHGQELLKGSYVSAGLAGALFAGATVAFFTERESRVTTVSWSPLGVRIGGTF